MKKIVLLVVAGLFAAGLIVSACDDDEKVKCDEDKVTKCTEDSVTCATNAVSDPDPTAAAEACTQTWCDCVDKAGCDISEYDNQNICK